MTINVCFIYLFSMLLQDLLADSYTCGAHLSIFTGIVSTAASVSVIFILTIHAFVLGGFCWSKMKLPML